MDDLSGPSSSSISNGRSGCADPFETTIPTARPSSPSTTRGDRYDRRRHVRRRSVPLSDQGESGGSTSSSSSSSPHAAGTRNRRRKELDDPRLKIQQVFFPPFEESSSAFVPAIDERVDGEKTTEGWARLLSHPAEAAATPPPPPSRPCRRSMLNHRRTQSSTDILVAIAPTSRTPLRPSGFSLNQMEPPARAQTTVPLVMNVKPPNVSISPLTRSARRMLNVDDEEMREASPIEACPGGDGLVEVIKLDRLNTGRKGEGSIRVPQEDQRLLRRSATLPTGRNKRKALSADLTVSANRRYPAVPPRALTRLPEITINEPPKARNRPPPLRNLPPPSWSSPGPSPPLTSLATPFSTDMFVMPYPNPVATMTPGLLSPNYTPPHSPGHDHHHQQSRSVPVTPRSNPMEELCSPDHPIPPRIRRRSSLASLESSTETIRPWHLVQLTPKPSRAQLSSSAQGDDVLAPGPTTMASSQREGKPPQTKRAANDHRSNPTLGLELETLVCDWDFESDEDRGRTVGVERKRRMRTTTARAVAGAGAGVGRRGAGRDPVDRERRARSFAGEREF